jgi:hypothetical protein
MELLKQPPTTRAAAQRFTGDECTGPRVSARAGTW